MASMYSGTKPGMEGAQGGLAEWSTSALGLHALLKSVFSSRPLICLKKGSRGCTAPRSKLVFMQVGLKDPQEQRLRGRLEARLG